MSPQFPTPEPLEPYFRNLAQMLAQTSWLPDPAVVQKLNRPVFPSMPDMRHRIEIIKSKNNAAIGMFDDNTTPEWALLWAHGLEGARPSGWSVIHVWPVTKDLNTYTHLANLALVRETLASLTDKEGPLTAYLRWHAWQVYGWKPESEKEPTQPAHYAEIQWRYLEETADPQALIRQRFNKMDNPRIKVLRPIMEKLGTL